MLKNIFNCPFLLCDQKYLSDNNYIKIDGNNTLVSDLKLEKQEVQKKYEKIAKFHMSIVLQIII